MVISYINENLRNTYDDISSNIRFKLACSSDSFGNDP